ncbi:uncharacterized protein LOC144353134 [Saccoglossus kowalevskii]
MLKEWDHFLFRDGVLYRQRTDSNGQKHQQLVLSPEYCQVAMEGLHDKIGHLGKERGLDLLRSRFYWPHMAHDLDEKIRNCPSCILRKASSGKPTIAPMVSIHSSQPMQLVCMDYLTLEESKGGICNILVIYYILRDMQLPYQLVTKRQDLLHHPLWLALGPGQKF